MMILCILMLKVPSMPLFGVCRWRSGCSLLFQIDITIRRARDSGVRPSMFQFPSIKLLHCSMRCTSSICSMHLILDWDRTPGDISDVLPTTETVVEGVERITLELMALGYTPCICIMHFDQRCLFRKYPPTEDVCTVSPCE